MSKPIFQPYGAAEEKLAQVENLEKGIKYNEFHPKAPRECEGCGKFFTSIRFMVDAKINFSGNARATMCATCFESEGESLEWGKGKLYTQLESGQWLMTGGFPPQ